jgi:hypothetical protein
MAKAKTLEVKASEQKRTRSRTDNTSKSALRI